MDHSEWPANKSQYRISVESEPDEEGRQSFTMFWWTEDGRPRAQCFHARVADYQPDRLGCGGRKLAA